MSSREQLDRRQLAKIAGGAAAAFSLAIPLRSHAQDDAAATEAANATATVSLPSNQAGLSPLPVAPTEIKRKADAMFARHNELLAAKRKK